MDHMNAPLLNEYYARNHVNPMEVYRPHMVNLPIPQGVLDLLGGEIDDNVVNLEFQVARITQKLKEFKENWQTFLLKEWMNKVTAFFDAIGLGALTAWITFDFCDFMKLIGIPTSIEISYSGMTIGTPQTSTLSEQTVNPPEEGA